MGAVLGTGRPQSALGCRHEAAERGISCSAEREGAGGQVRAPEYICRASEARPRGHRERGVGRDRRGGRE